jgi:hypothetical protein
LVKHRNARIHALLDRPELDGPGKAVPTRGSRIFAVKKRFSVEQIVNPLRQVEVG